MVLQLQVVNQQQGSKRQALSRQADDSASSSQSAEQGSRTAQALSRQADDSDENILNDVFIDNIVKKLIGFDEDFKGKINSDEKLQLKSKDKFLEKNRIGFLKELQKKLNKNGENKEYFDEFLHLNLESFKYEFMSFSEDITIIENIYSFLYIYNEKLTEILHYHYQNYYKNYLNDFLKSEDVFIKSIIEGLKKNEKLSTRHRVYTRFK